MTAEGLTEAERKALYRANGSRGDLVTTVERILADRLAEVQAERDALRERVEALAGEWTEEGPSLVRRSYDGSHAYDDSHVIEGLTLTSCARDLRAALDADR